MADAEAELLPADDVRWQPSKRTEFAFSRLRGRRERMEDNMVALGEFRGREDEDLLAVFDGFAGPDASAYAASRMPEILAAELELAETVRAARAGDGGDGDDAVFEMDMEAEAAPLSEAGQAFQSAVDSFSRKGLLSFDDDIDEKFGDCPTEYDDVLVVTTTVALTRAFSQLATEIRDQRIPGGTTALLVYITGDYLFCANIGDTRAILRREDRRLPIWLSVDHKASSPGEQQRIQSEGGVVQTVPGSVPRVNGVMAVTRAFAGEFGRNQSDTVGIISTPQIKCVKLGARDSALILASDGLWDKLSDKMVSMMAASELRQTRPLSESVQAVSKELVTRAYQANSLDNITVITACPLAGRTVWGA